MNKCVMNVLETVASSSGCLISVLARDGHCPSCVALGEGRCLSGSLCVQAVVLTTPDVQRGTK